MDQGHWKFTWRVTADGDFYEQNQANPDLIKALRFWSKFWGVDANTCVVFTVEKLS